MPLLQVRSVVTSSILTSMDVCQILKTVRRVAVLGAKTEEQSDQPAFYVPAYLVSAGLEVIPVPVYYPEVTTILDRKVYRRLLDIPGEIDLVDVFRRPTDLMQHLDDLIAKKPRIVWLQSGIRHAIFSQRLSEQGITVIEDRCLMVEHRRCAARTLHE